MLNIATAFATSSQSVSMFFQKPGVAYYIPLYQRPYSWDSDNIEKLMEDICSGVSNLGTPGTHPIIHFLGTVILVREQNPAINIQPQDPKGLPPSILNVIDGQQRISTIALLSCLLYKRIFTVKNIIPSDAAYVGLHQAIDMYLPRLLEIFSVDLLMGTPTRKPIIIRGSEDLWTLNGSDTNYPSDVAALLAGYIRAATFKGVFPILNNKTLVGSNVDSMDKWLNSVEKAHEIKTDDFLPAWRVLQLVPETDLWGFSRPELVAIVHQQQLSPQGGVESKVCSIVQLLAFCHFLLQRCCFTEILPISESWAFDMFQSLNATGTPLTAIETFKPLVVNTVNQLDGGFKDSLAEDDFEKIDALFKPMRTAADKTKRTRDYLTTFALSHDGKEKLSSRFSEQRAWLDSAYKKCTTQTERTHFVWQMGSLATYWSRLLSYDPVKMLAFPGLELLPTENQRLAGLSLLYIQDANHAMANSILSRFYASIIEYSDTMAAQEFVESCKAVAAFFTIWRSALPNTGLDDEYRSIVKNHFSWQKSLAIRPNANMLRSLFRQALQDNKIGDIGLWKNKARENLRYDTAKTVCRFTLFVASHDTIEDPKNPGLIIPGTLGTALYLDPVKWESNDCKSIEHVAPQDMKAGWDSALYPDDDVQRIGNLILLPIEINSAVGSKGWFEKWIHYRHMAEKNPANLTALRAEASKGGVNLGQKFIAALEKTPYQSHMSSIMDLGASGKWDKKLVQLRTERICDILWARMMDWLT